VVLGKQKLAHPLGGEATHCCLLDCLEEAKGKSEGCIILKHVLQNNTHKMKQAS